MAQRHSNTELRITILVDNRTTDGLVAEHGFSLWIETGAERIVFDTGQGAALPQNARKLGLDWAKADHLVLSHGHHDHTGGLRYLLAQTPGIHVHCHPGVVQPRYSLSWGNSRPVHMPSASRTALDHLPGHRLHWILQPATLGQRAGLSGPIPRGTAYEDTGGPFFLDPQGSRPDLVDDDLALWFRTRRGLVVCVGCCHSGLINTLQHMLHVNRGEKIHTVIGGFHLLKAGAERLRQTAEALRTFSPERVIACHCTGEMAVAAFCDSLGERVVQGAAGQQYWV